MATLAHVSHYGLTPLADIETLVRFEGPMGNCKRLAAAHGLEWQAGWWYSPISHQSYARLTLLNNGQAVGAIMDMRRESQRLDQHQVCFSRHVWETQ